MAYSETGVCAICGDVYTHFGNNPEPLLDDYEKRVCDWCNDALVLPCRMLLMRAPEASEDFAKLSEKERIIYMIAILDKKGESANG